MMLAVVRILDDIRHSAIILIAHRPLDGILIEGTPLAILVSHYRPGFHNTCIIETASCNKQAVVKEVQLVGIVAERTVGNDIDNCSESGSIIHVLIGERGVSRVRSYFFT